MSNAWYKLTISIVALGVVLLWLVYRQPASATAIPNSLEAHEIIAAMNRARQLLDTPYDQLDVNTLATVLIDHPDYQRKVDPEVKMTLQAQISATLGMKAGQNFGYLTAMKAKRLLQQRGGKLLKAAMEKAKSEKRDLTPGEWQALAKQNGGMAPGLPNPHPDPLAQQFRYESLEIDGDKAHIRYDNGVRTKTALLVRINGHWYVAGIF